MWTLATTQSSSREQLVGVVERAVGADVDLRAGEQAEARVAVLASRRAISSIRSQQRVAADVVAEAVAGRVVGDREVGVAALARRLGHLLERVAAVGEGRVAVEVAADVGER